MRRTNLLIFAYIGLLVVLATLILLISFKFTNSSSIFTIDFAFLLILATLAEGFSLKLHRNFATTAVPPVHIACIFLLPPPAVILVVFFAITVMEIRDKSKLHKIIFNIAHHVITGGLPALLVYFSGTWGDLRQANNPQVYLIVGLVIALYYVLDVALVDLAIAIVTHGSALRIWLNINRKGQILDLTLASLGILMAIVWLQSPLFCLLLILPILVNQDAFRNLYKLEQETRQAIIDITELVEARDPYTFGHSLRVAGYCKAIARELGLGDEEVDRISLAGRVHDLGKIGVSDQVLLKPGKLNEQEWVEMRRHAETGAQILSNYSSYREDVLDVLHHHESWDGNGYPAKISGEQIPLGARIIAVADSFDAMTTDRPYRKGMPIERSINILLERRNLQWDEHIVNAFVKMVLDQKNYPEVAALLTRPLVRTDETVTLAASSVLNPVKPGSMVMTPST